MKKVALSFGMVLAVVAVFAQPVPKSPAESVVGGPTNLPADGVVDGVYVKTHVPTNQFVQYEHVREADYIWGNRVWRQIDLREKINHPLLLPYDRNQLTLPDQPSEWVRNNSRWSLWTIMKQHIMTGEFTLYSPYNTYDVLRNGERDGDQFKYPIRPEAGLNYWSDSTYRANADSYIQIFISETFEPVLASDGTDSVVYDIDGNATYITKTVKVYEPVMAQHIAAYRIKEDWFFDKERSVMDVRIMGISPVIYEGLKEGGKYQELFWLYFPQCRPILNLYYVYNDKNDAQWQSFDDFFWKRRFSSVIYKESNVYEREIEEFRIGVDALLESDRITEEMRNFEHDVWHF
jgi:gliding motility associated protien GldN